MATPQKLKYIAEGYLEDSNKLLNEFINLGTVEISDFASLWQKHLLSLIFMGRPTDAELTEFTNEIFRITANYLFSTSFHQQVGAVYMLYALFLNQISKPSIKIRITFDHMKVLQSLRDTAKLKNYQTLHFVIYYLKEHAFLCVVNQTLKGPLLGHMPKSSKHDESICTLKTTYKSDLMNYNANNNLAILRDLQIKYVAQKKKINSSRVNLVTSHEIYEEAIRGLHEIVNPSSEMADDVGNRRAKIKAEAFIKKSRNRFGMISDDEVEIEAEVDPDYGSRKKPRGTRPRRTPKEERKIGRPSLKPKKEPSSEELTESKSDDELDIAHLLTEQLDIYQPPENYESRKLRTKRDPYYQASPKRESSDSDTDISE